MASARGFLWGMHSLRVPHRVFRCGVYSKKEEGAVSVAAMWFILGIILLAVELVSPVFVLFFFGLGAWAAGVTALFVDDLAIEVVVFGASSVVFLLSLASVVCPQLSRKDADFIGCRVRGAAESARRENGDGNPAHSGKRGRGDFGGRQFLARGVPGSAAGGGAGACLGAYPR